MATDSNPKGSVAGGCRLEKSIVICDVCTEPAATTITVKVKGETFVKDVCNTHLSEFLNGARAPRPGRRAGLYTDTLSPSLIARLRATEGALADGNGDGAMQAAPKKRGRPRKTEAQSAETAATPKKRGRPRKTEATETPKRGPGRPRKVQADSTPKRKRGRPRKTEAQKAESQKERETVAA